MNMTTCGNCGYLIAQDSIHQPHECLHATQAHRDSLLAMLKEVLVAGRGLFLVLDPRAGVGERMGIMWDHLHAVVDEADRTSAKR